MGLTKSWSLWWADVRREGLELFACCSCSGCDSGSEFVRPGKSVSCVALFDRVDPCAARSVSTLTAAVTKPRHAAQPFHTGVTVLSLVLLAL